MNLNAIVAGAIGTVNPNIAIEVRQSTGYTTEASGKRVPTYADPVCVMGQVQPMTYRDLQQVEGLNLQGTRRKIYINGRLDGVVRSQIKGGDLISVAGGVNCGEWLVAQVLEQFPDWCSVAVTLQNGA